MPDPKLQAYLASHYLSGPKADAILARTEGGDKPKKKKKRRLDPASASASASTGLVLKDEDDAWKNAGGADDDDDDELGFAPQVVKDRGSSGFKKASWNSVRQGQGSAGSTPQPTDDAGQASTTPQPQDSPAEPVIKAGLKTKEQMKAERLAREQRAKEQEAAAATGSSSRSVEAAEAAVDRPDQETVYRDASGRRIDVKAEEEERRRQKLLEERKKRERDEWGKGLTQRREREEEARRLAQLRDARIEQRADDDDVVRHFKSVERWDDPALAFMTKKRSAGPQKPSPGYRWDGVDRSNGFEKMLFQRKNALSRRDAEARAWGQEDM
ncbi:related to BUD13 - subunit of the RES complex, required for pre-mRNA retention and splicing [Pseudozyma flocculosa]|uniref:Related to BUD13 - subunit of the RES complex, required for pre-mRNA retention and splicing n=1 Tax=Pseudozyma flocculosa TaxID=84751 RepID=A0A5C3ETE0_9BASI|nr:related to BUD13 - subunit of the RES complex, required for pre-mRNA retention and splicing [Pseudozyma flocculosa]